MVDDVNPAVYAAPRRRPRAPGRGLVVLLLLIGFGTAMWVARAPLLRGAAELWIVSDPVGPADTVAVLGGGLPTRPVAAATYYRQGLVEKALVANVRLDENEALDIVPSHTVLNRRALVSLGVPENAIELFGTDVSNTYEEVLALREWAVRAHVRSIIVPTGTFASRRLRWMFDRVFAGIGIKIQVVAIDSTDYSRAAWWRTERGLVDFQNEVIKYVYYRLKY